MKTNNKVLNSEEMKLLSSLTSEEDVLVECRVRKYFSYICAAYTTSNSIEYYSPYPWNSAIHDGYGWHHFLGIPNKVETCASALKRAWYRAKWMNEGTLKQRYCRKVPF